MRRINKQHSTNSMETSDLLKRVRQIEIKTRGLSNNIFAGQYHSAFKGKGMSFSEVREYQYGDDVRDIDWNVTARYNKPFVKVFEEERELTVMLLIDVSNSLDFGTVKQLKKDMVFASGAFFRLRGLRAVLAHGMQHCDEHQQREHGDEIAHGVEGERADRVGADVLRDEGGAPDERGQDWENDLTDLIVFHSGNPLAMSAANTKAVRLFSPDCR